MVDNRKKIDSTGEFSLLMLVRMLYWNRGLVSIIVLVSVVVAFAFSLKMEQKWTSEMIVKRPNVNQISTIIEKNNFLKLFSTDKLVNDKSLQDKIFKKYIELFNSYDNKASFLSMKKKVDSKVFLDSNYESLMKNIKIQSVDEGFYKLEFIGFTPQSAQSNLIEYSEFTNKNIRKEYEKDFSIFKTLIRNDLTLSLSILTKNAKSLKSNDMEKTKLSLKITKGANLEKPLKINDNDELFRIDFGSKALSEKNKVLNNNDLLALYEPNILMVENKLSLLGTFKSVLSSDFNSFYVTKSALLPKQKSSPPRTLIIVLAAIFGIFLSTLVVAIKCCFINKDYK